MSEEIQNKVGWLYNSDNEEIEKYFKSFIEQKILNEALPNKINELELIKIKKPKL